MEGRKEKYSINAGALPVFLALMLLFLAPQVAKVAAMLGTADYFMVCMFGLTIIAGISGDSICKGIVAYNNTVCRPARQDVAASNPGSGRVRTSISGASVSKYSRTK